MVLRLCWRSYGNMARFKRPIVIPDCELQAIFGQELRNTGACGMVPGQVHVLILGYLVERRCQNFDAPVHQLVPQVILRRYL